MLLMPINPGGFAAGVLFYMEWNVSSIQKKLHICSSQ
jgi:hypothetical protein